MIEIQHSNRRVYLWYYAPLIIWIAVIFTASSNIGSMSNTSRFIGPLLHFLFPMLNEAQITATHAVIRKCAHFVFYATLGWLAARAFWRLLGANKFAVWCFAALALVVAIASLDEFNQSFNAARTSSIYDVLLDTSGGLFAILVWLLIFGRRTD